MSTFAFIYLNTTQWIRIIFRPLNKIMIYTHPHHVRVWRGLLCLTICYCFRFCYMKDFARRAEYFIEYILRERRVTFTSFAAATADKWKNLKIDLNACSKKWNYFFSLCLIEIEKKEDLKIFCEFRTHAHTKKGRHE